MLGDSEMTVWQSLPDEVTMMVFKMLEFPDLKNVRLVCKHWDTLVRDEVPMSITIDDKLDGNVEFIKNVVKKKVNAVRICEIGTIHALLQPKRLHLLTKIELNGNVHPNFFCCVLPRFLNLQKLIIREETFLRNLFFDQQFVLRKLKSLNIYSPFNPRRGTGGFMSRDAELLFGENLRGLLANVSCPLLETFIVDGDVDQLHLPSDVEWKSAVLRNFLEMHRKTLKHMLIGESSIVKLRITDGVKILRIPQYKSLHVSFNGKGVFRYYPPAHAHELDWCEILHSQVELDYLNIGVLWYPFISHVLSKLPSTLRYVSVYWNTSVNTFDANLFSELTNLEQLELTFDGTGIELLVNFQGWASCRKLKALVLEQIVTPLEFVESIPIFFPRLEMLYLFRCSSAEFQNHRAQLPPGEFGITRLALSRLINMRTLDYLFVGVDDFLGPETTRRQMISWLLDSARYDSATNGYHMGEEPSYPDIFST